MGVSSGLRKFQSDTPITMLRLSSEGESVDKCGVTLGEEGGEGRKEGEGGRKKGGERRMGEEGRKGRGRRGER